MSEHSKSAIPANTLKTIRPAGVVVSAQGSASERNSAQAYTRECGGYQTLSPSKGVESAGTVDRLMRTA
jgi:hypothetical protein